MNGASQGTFIKDVKEDLKKNSFHQSKNINQTESLDEQQIYGLTCICGNKAVTLPVQTNDPGLSKQLFVHPGGPILKNLRAASEKTKSTHGKIW